MNDQMTPERTMTRRDRCTHIIITLSRSGGDPEIYEALEEVMASRGLSALTDEAIEELATRVATGEHVRRYAYAESRVIFLDQYVPQRKSEC